MTLPWRRLARVTAGILVLGGLVTMAVWPETTPVDVVTVTRGPMTVTIDETGTTRVRDRFIVSAPVAGRLERIALEPGDRVVRGRTVLARLTAVDAPLLDPRTRAELAAALSAAESAIGQARAERARVQTTLQQAQSTLRRQEALMRAGAIAGEALDAARTAVETLESQLRAAEFAVSRAEQERDVVRARLDAPPVRGRVVPVIAAVDGVVLRLLRQSESVVPIGEPLVELADPSRLEVVADLLSTEAVQVQAGAPVRLEAWGGPQPLEGRVRRIDPAGFTKLSALGVEEQRVNVVIDVAPSESAARLGDGFRVDVRIIVWQGDAVRQVPAGALFRRGTGWAAFTVDGDRARLRPVTIGRQTDTMVEVTGGLDDSAPVVLHPPDTLTDGARITVRAEP